MNKRVLGDTRENIAAAYLENNGYFILERNFRCRMGEIDIVANEGGYIVFVEVKYRADLKYGAPAFAVDRKKQHTIYNVASFYLKKNGISFDTPVRFDVIAITGSKIELIKNAFGVM